MVIAHPQPKARDAIAQIDAYMRTGEQIPDELTIKRLRRDLTDSLVADASEGYAGLGMLETLLWHSEDARRYFDTAVRLHNEFTVHANYAMCMARLGEIAEAAEQARIAANMAPADISAVERATNYSMLAGELETAKAWAERLRNLMPGIEPRDAVAVEAILAVLDTSGLHESVIAQCNRLAYSLAGSNQIAVGMMSSEADLQDGIVLLTLSLIASQDKVLELDAMLGSQLFEQVPNYDPSKYWVGFAAPEQL